MSEIASRQQLRLAFLRWAAVTVPLVLLLGYASSRLAPSGSRNAWYASLAKPATTPPDWAFPLAWTILYVLIGLALAMVLNARGSRFRRPAILLFVVQFLVNLAWAPLFFGAHRVVWALADAGLMFALAAATAVLFARVRRAAGLLMLPYLLWILFAVFLTWQIHQLNPNAETILVPAASSAQINI